MTCFEYKKIWLIKFILFKNISQIGFSSPLHENRIQQTLLRQFLVGTKTTEDFDILLLHYTNLIQLRKSVFLLWHMKVKNHKKKEDKSLRWKAQKSEFALKRSWNVFFGSKSGKRKKNWCLTLKNGSINSGLKTNGAFFVVVMIEIHWHHRFWERKCDLSSVVRQKMFVLYFAVLQRFK